MMYNAFSTEEILTSALHLAVEKGQNMIVLDILIKK